MSARLALRTGASSAWERWYRNKVSKELLRPCAMDRYVYVTLAEVEVARDCPAQALVVIAPWQRIFELCEHAIDLIMLDTITAIAISPDRRRERHL